MISQAVSFTSRALNAIKITHNTYRFSSCLPRPSINQITIAYTALDLQNMAETKSSKNDAAITDIEDLHRHAIMNKQSTYIDPATGFTVFTELSHLKRGKCCGNMCRHCPYGWSNVRDASEENASSARAVSGSDLKYHLSLCCANGIMHADVTRTHFGFQNVEVRCRRKRPGTHGSTSA